MRVSALALLGVLAAAGTAAASTFSISPIRLELSSTKTTAVLAVHNQDNSPVVVQAQPFAWSQVHGEDQLDETHDVLVTPPVFTLPPQGEQIVRVALRSPADASRELDYRLVLDEVLPEKPADFTGLRVALRVTLPVFVTAQSHAAPDLSWHHRWLGDGALQIEARNGGAAHIQVRDLDVQTADRASRKLHSDTAHYILPGSFARWQLRGLSPGATPNRVIVRGHSDAGDFTVTSDAEIE